MACYTHIAVCNSCLLLQFGVDVSLSVLHLLLYLVHFITHNNQHLECLQGPLFAQVMVLMSDTCNDQQQDFQCCESKLSLHRLCCYSILSLGRLDVLATPGLLET